MMNLLTIKNKNGLTLNRGIATDIDGYLKRFKKLHDKLNIDSSEYLDIEVIQINVNYETLYNNKFLNRFDITELKEIKFIPITRHLYKILRLNY